MQSCVDILGAMDSKAKTELNTIMKISKGESKRS